MNPTRYGYASVATFGENGGLQPHHVAFAPTFYRSFSNWIETFLPVVLSSEATNSAGRPRIVAAPHATRTSPRRPCLSRISTNSKLNDPTTRTNLISRSVSGSSFLR